MPLYDYDCAACGTRFEGVHGLHADPPAVCAVCGGGPVRKAFAAPAIHFKGSGWAKKERRATATAGKNGAAKVDAGTSDGAAKTDGSAGSPESSGSAGSTESSGAASDGKDRAASATKAAVTPGPATD